MTLLIAKPASPAVDFETKSVKTDPDGRPLYQVDLAAFGGGETLVVTVRIPGNPPALAVSTPVRVHGLVALPWVMGERSGVSFRASALEALTSTAASTRASSGG